MSNIAELGIIENLKSIAGENSLGLNDDCAVFEEYCVTKDLLSEGVHFFDDDDSFNLARKIIRVNLSDLAAMGAEPFGVLIGWFWVMSAPFSLAGCCRASHRRSRQQAGRCR